MNNALEEGNLPMEGQSNDRAGHQDKSTQQQEQSNDWESQAKYFQSEKDKLHVENQKLKQYEEVGKFLESRPDITQAVAQMAQGGQPIQPQRIAMNIILERDALCTRLNRVTLNSAGTCSQTKRNNKLAEQGLLQPPKC